MKQYETFELTLKGKRPENSEALADIHAVFELDGEKKEVEGFYDGDGTYKVRFLPQKTGDWNWRVTGVVEASGTEKCTSSDNPDAHGVVRAVDTHFEFEDGTRFLPFGTTIYAMMHQPEECIEETYRTLQEAPFNKVRHCVFPKFYDYNKEDPEFYPFEKKEDGSWDVHRPCYKFWQHFENGIYRLAEMGIQTDLILFHPYDNWGFMQLSAEECSVYLQYVMRRFAAIPEVWWSMANEYDIVLTRTMEDWYLFEDIITSHDPYQHLLSNHSCIKYYENHREKITHLSMQTAWMEKAADWIKEYRKPVIFDECCYEGDLPLNWGNISGFEMVHRFWSAYTVGAYATHGEVFLSEDEVLWWAKGGKLKGESPKRIAFLRSIMEELPQQLEEWDNLQAIKDGDENFKKYMEYIDVLRNSISELELDALDRKDKECRGHIGDEVFLYYLGHHCNRLAGMNLPENHTYQVEVIDTWNMTRETIFTEASGKTLVTLPGREGMAILAKGIKKYE